MTEQERLEIEAIEGKGIDYIVRSSLNKVSPMTEVASSHYARIISKNTINKSAKSKIEEKKREKSESDKGQESPENKHVTNIYISDSVINKSNIVMKDNEADK